MRYIVFGQFPQSITKSGMSIAKRCPNGYHNINGQCVDANGQVYQKKEEEPIKSKNKKQDEDDNVPEHIEIREISDIRDRGMDIDLAEAEYIFNPKQGADKYKEAQERYKALDLVARERLGELTSKENEVKADSVTVLTELLKVYSDAGDFAKMSVTEPSESQIGQSIEGNNHYIYATVNDLSDEALRLACLGIIDSFNEMPFLKKIQFGATKSSVAGAVTWSRDDGSAIVRFEVKCYNELYHTPMDNAGRQTTRDVPGEYSYSTTIHELTHAYINQIVHTALEKRFKLVKRLVDEKKKKMAESGGVSIITEPSMSRSDYCGLVTHGDGSYVQGILDTYSGKIDDSELDDKYLWINDVASLPNQIVNDARKIAKSVYGVNTDKFMRMVTSYGNSKGPKEMIPEAMSDVITNGKNATFSNKLIVLSLQRYANFFCGSDDEDLEPIINIVNRMKASQKKKSKATKSISQINEEYITFAQLYTMELD